MSYLYHFLFAGNLKRNQVTPEQHFNDIKEGGLLLPISLREQWIRGCVTKQDPKEDWDYVFLTPNRNLWKEAWSNWQRVEHFNKHVSYGEYGFVFDIGQLRHHPDVFLRNQDCLWKKDKCATEPFTNQDVVEKNEILVFGMLDLDLAVAEIINGVEHVRCSQNEGNRDSHKQATHCSKGREEQGIH